MSMGVAAAWIAGATVVGAVISSDAAKSSANQIAGAENSAIGLQQAEYNNNMANLQPYMGAGNSALDKINAGFEPGGQFQGSFTPEDFLNNEDPAYGFLQQQGQMALEKSAAARGVDLSSGNLQNLTAYGQGLASQEYGNAYNRYMTTRNTNYQELANIAGLGENAAAQAGNTGAGITNAMSNSLVGSAQAQAAGTVGSANAITGALGQGVNAYTNYGLLQGLMGNGTLGSGSIQQPPGGTWPGLGGNAGPGQFPGEDPGLYSGLNGLGTGATTSLAGA
jgi:hypothetical protein